MIGTPSRLLKKSASGVLASLRGSTYRRVRLAVSLAAALLDGLFDQLARCQPLGNSLSISCLKTASHLSMEWKSSINASVNGDGGVGRHHPRGTGIFPPVRSWVSTA